MVVRGEDLRRFWKGGKSVTLSRKKPHTDLNGVLIGRFREGRTGVYKDRDVGLPSGVPEAPRKVTEEQ